MSRPKISLFRTPRTGSTMVQRAIRIVADFPDNQCGHNPFRSVAPLIVTCRDWRDVCVSQWRIRYGHDREHPTPGQLTTAIHVTDKRLKQLEYMIRTNPDYRAWRYEDTYNRVMAVAGFLQEIVERELDARELSALTEIVPTCAVLELQDALPKPDRAHRAFDVLCKQTSIHKNHMSVQHKGRPGAWREIVPARYHKMLNDHYQRQLIDWGYQ